jgi:hypothetical protein
MSLHGLQCALAQLFTDPAMRVRYATAPDAFADRFALSERDRAQLAALAASAVAYYAATLARKRRSETARLLPKTSLALGPAFVTTYEDWAQTTRLATGPRRYARDASAFCRHLLARRASLPPGTETVVAAELRRLRPGLAGFFRPR